VMRITSISQSNPLKLLQNYCRAGGIRVGETDFGAPKIG
jgi:hypothetical protein